MRAPQNCHAARTHGGTHAGAAQCQGEASLRWSTPEMRDLRNSFDSCSSQWAFASRNHSKKTITRPKPRRCTRIAGTLKTARPQGESDHGGSDTIARVHACRLLHAPRDAIPVPFADQAPLESCCARPAARACCTPAPPPTPAVVIRLRPSSARGLGIAVLGAAARCCRAARRRQPAAWRHGPSFGLGPDPRPVSRRAPAGSATRPRLLQP